MTDTPTRAAFLASLRTALRGAPDAALREIESDYAAHFDEGRAQGRTDDDIAAALGDPLTLADELRISLRVDAWEREPSVASGIRLLGAALKLGALNTFVGLFVAPILLVLALAGVVFVAALAIVGAWLLIAGGSLELPGGVATTLLAGTGLIAGAASGAALLVLAATALANGAGKYARLHLSHLQASNAGAPR